jgi:colicin import membrane protein
MGTRFLPATKAVPKELLPIIDTPALQLILDEAAGAGIGHVVIVTSHAKPAIEAYFEPAPEVVAKLREENLKRITGQAGVEGATGASGATGTALQASGPSPSYAGRIRARIKPNIVFSEEIAGNPVAEVEVRAAPDGTIVGRKLIKSSGVANWDEAVLKAIDKTEVLPRDTDGRVPSPLVISFRPKD